MTYDNLLEEFAHKFYGYGNIGADYWLIGMEEGGGNSFYEVTKRLDVWVERGKRELEDIAEFHEAIGIKQYFNKGNKLQNTWNKLIRIILSVSNNHVSRQQILDYQRLVFARKDSDTCLMELLPLPSPSTDKWIYGEHSQISYLASRDKYRTTCLQWRIPHLRKRIQEYQPRVVIFYGTTYREYWYKLIQGKFETISEGVELCQKDKTLSLIVKHPASYGLRNKYLEGVGQLIKTYL